MSISAEYLPAKQRQDFQLKRTLKLIKYCTLLYTLIQQSYFGTKYLPLDIANRNQQISIASLYCIQVNSLRY
jgi:hypothetical protein